MNPMFCQLDMIAGYPNPRRIIHRRPLIAISPASDYSVRHEKTIVCCYGCGSSFRGYKGSACSVRCSRDWWAAQSARKPSKRQSEMITKSKRKKIISDNLNERKRKAKIIRESIIKTEQARQEEKSAWYNQFDLMHSISRFCDIEIKTASGESKVATWSEAMTLLTLKQAKIIGRAPLPITPHGIACKQTGGSP
jgi:hypothetical protein